MVDSESEQRRARASIEGLSVRKTNQIGAQNSLDMHITHLTTCKHVRRQLFKLWFMLCCVYLGNDQIHRKLDKTLRVAQEENR
jgi:hypothetical protein